MTTRIDPITGEPWEAGNWWHWWCFYWHFIGVVAATADLAAKCGIANCWETAEA